ncbi:imelysin family protein [Microbaculum marinum]|uniref:Imelysin family protein n=1 Tax=Microbaculum marinum TaxID=1764581 RepID=A0AAW9RPU0_9HYPH
MRTLIAALGPVLGSALAILLASTLAHAGAPKDIGANLVDGYIRPATTQFSGDAAAMTRSLESFCGAPDAAGEAEVHARFDALVRDWFAVMILRFGPLVEDNRFERIFFWPDPRGVTLRQVQGLLAGDDPAAVDAARLAEKSVAVQGLPALEYALYGTGSDGLLTDSDQGRYRCAYALAVSRRIAATAGGLADAWAPGSAYARDFSMPGPDNDVYRDDGEVTAEAIKAMATGLVFVADAVVTPFLGDDPAKANYKRAPFWRSGQALPAIATTLTAVRDFYSAAGFAGSLDQSDQWIDGSLRFEIRSALAALDSVDVPLEQAVAPGPARDALTYVVIAMKSIHTTIETVLAQAAGVAVGFNALDGD